jgi:hypothetical protein
MIKVSDQKDSIFQTNYQSVDMIDSALLVRAGQEKSFTYIML